MSHREVDNFLLKFKILWKYGYDAHLDIDTHAGQAWVGLRVRVGEYPGHLYGKHHHARKKNSPARQRRRQKREQIRHDFH